MSVVAKHTITEEQNKANRHHGLMVEAKKNAQVGKWAPVLQKMTEVPSQKYGLMAAM